MKPAPHVVSLAPPGATHCPDVICLSHLRWDFVFQRPQHLMTRCARSHRVFFLEESAPGGRVPRVEVTSRQSGVKVAIPYIPEDCANPDGVHAALLEEVLRRHRIRDYVLWYYTPMALKYTRHLAPAATVYDCMDELSAFAGAPPGLQALEHELMQRADLVLTGGRSLYEHKRHQHSNIHPFPSSVDVQHFRQARSLSSEPDDQASIPHPRLGYFGVVDERMDLDLIAGVAAARPDWHLVMLGPLAKIDAASLPHAANIHYLGAKSYAQLPDYLAGWDVALLPFAHNGATRFISPTKTPEYLAAGCPVVSTTITDVMRPYGQIGLARIADSVPEFVTAATEALAEDRTERLRQADAFLAHTSWDGTWNRIYALLQSALRGRHGDIDTGAVGSGGVA